MKAIDKETGNEFLVMGLIFNDTESMCVVGDYLLNYILPFAPTDFEITDNNIPLSWHLNKYNKNHLSSYQKKVGHGCSADYIAGYYELCFDHDHFTRVIERERDALEIYYQRKYETYKLPETPVHQLFEQYEEVKIKGMDNNKRYFIEEFVDDDNCLVTSYNGEIKEITIYTDKYKLSKVTK